MATEISRCGCSCIDSGGSVPKRNEFGCPNARRHRRRPSQLRLRGVCRCSQCGAVAVVWCSTRNSSEFLGSISVAYVGAGDSFGVDISDPWPLRNPDNQEENLIRDYRVEAVLMHKADIKAAQQALREEAIRAISTGSNLTYKEIGSQFGVSEAYIRQLAVKNGFIRKPGSGSPAARAKRQARKLQAV
jgi:hypothetical protein